MMVKIAGVHGFGMIAVDALMENEMTVAETDSNKLQPLLPLMSKMTPWSSSRYCHSERPFPQPSELPTGPLASTSGSACQLPSCLPNRPTRRGGSGGNLPSARR